MFLYMHICLSLQFSYLSLFLWLFPWICTHVLLLPFITHNFPLIWNPFNSWLHFCIIFHAQVLFSISISSSFMCTSSSSNLIFIFTISLKVKGL
jgi:hypothetical protein